MARPTESLIHLDRLAENLRAVKQLAGKSMVMAMVKADAYGHGLVRCADTLVRAGADWLGVASAEEGVILRKENITAPILVLGPLPEESETLCVQFGLDQSVFTCEAILRLEKEAEATGRTAGVHLKIETGMHRTGARPGTELARLLNTLSSCRHLCLHGVFTHFFSSDEPGDEPTLAQAEKLNEAVRQIKAAGFSSFLVHCANSAAILNYPSLHFDMVRAGIILYGYAPSEKGSKKITVKPVLTLKTAIVSLEELSAGETVSYGGTFTAQRQTRLAVLPIGYGDGYKRVISNRGCVLIRGKRAPIRGRICMDMMMVDVTDIPCDIGDEAVLIGTQGDEEITADEIALWADTISYEIMLSLTPRVTRNFTEVKL